MTRITQVVSVVAFLALVCSPRAWAEEHVVNGDFSAGNIGFVTDYSYRDGQITGSGQYTLATDTASVHPCAVVEGPYTDHTSGDGNMMAMNGQVNLVVWQQSVAVVPGASYTFSAWISSWCFHDTASLARLRFFIEGVQVGDDFVASATLGQWEEFSTQWNSGEKTSATLSIRDFTNASDGNDFALDDISLVGPAGIPAVSSWGLAAMTLLVLAAGTVVATRRRLAGGAQPG